MGAKATALQQELDAFKEQVRTEALRVAREQSWCDTGLNRSLRRLGLREKPQPRPVQVRITRQPRENEYTVFIEADSVEEARRVLAEDEARLRQEVRLQIGYGTANIARMEVVQPVAATQPAAATPGGVPRVGDRAPEEGDWYRRPLVSGDPRQCRELAADGRWYCTRPTGHAVSAESPHVATSLSEGVRAVWTEGGTPRSEWLGFSGENEDDDEGDDD